MAQQRTMYMHTIDEKPAFYSLSDGQIVYVDVLPRWQDRPNRALLRASVRQIMRDQARTVAHRKSWGFKDSGAGKYGYIIVTVPR